MDKKIQDSSNAKAGQAELKKSQAQVARDQARWKEYWKHIKLKVARQLRGENLAKHYHLQESEMVASPQVPVVTGQAGRELRLLGSYICCFSVIPAARNSSQVPVVSQPGSSCCLDRTSAVSQSYRHLTTAQVH